MNCFYLFAVKQGSPSLYWNDRQALWTCNPLAATLFEYHRHCMSQMPMARGMVDEGYEVCDMVWGEDADSL